MGIGSVMKKFGALALQVAPMAAAAAGLPTSFAPALALGVQIAQGMHGASNSEKAARAGAEAQIFIEQANAIRTQHGLPALVDETVAVSAIDHAVKLTFDMTKMLHTANGDLMPQAGT